MKSLTEEQLRGIDARWGAAVGPGLAEVHTYDRKLVATCATAEVAHFLSAAREDVPAMLAEIWVLREENRRLGRELAEMRGAADD